MNGNGGPKDSAGRPGGGPRGPGRPGFGHGGGGGGFRGPGGPGGPGGREGRDGRDGHRGRGRDRDRPGSGRGGAESVILGALHELEKPLTKGEFAEQKPHFAKILAALKPLRLKNIKELEFECSTKLFTALLRGGRQPASTDEAKEAVRKDLMFLIGEIWRAVNEEAHAGKLYAESGRTAPALKALEKSGEWQEVAALHRKEKRPLEAVKIYEQHEDWKGALEAWLEAGDAKGILRAALRAGNADEARKAAKALPLKTARELLFKAKQGDLFLELLAAKGEWFEIGQLYEHSEQFADAALAYERAAKLARAAEAYSKAGDLVNAARCLDREVKDRLAKHDAVGAGEVLRRAGQLDRAVELIAPVNPGLAFKWLQKEGQDAKALEFAKACAKERQGKPAEAASWLERAGELPLAAQAYLDAARFADAARIWESLGDWEKAGESAARAGLKEHAVELCGVEASPTPKPAPPSSLRRRRPQRRRPSQPPRTRTLRPRPLQFPDRGDGWLHCRSAPTRCSTRTESPGWARTPGG
ncbi:MAG: hypothetical protein QM765_21905 [Myxococcales bacterium]